MKATVLAATAGLAVALLAAALAAQNQAPPAAGKEFSGKVLVVSLKQDPKNPAMLEQVEVRRLADEAFLVGKWLRSPQGDESPARAVWLSLREVGQIIEYDSVKDLEKDFRR